MMFRGSVFGRCCSVEMFWVATGVDAESDVDVDVDVETQDGWERTSCPPVSSGTLDKESLHTDFVLHRSSSPGTALTVGKLNRYPLHGGHRQFLEVDHLWAGMIDRPIGTGDQ